MRRTIALIAVVLGLVFATLPGSHAASRAPKGTWDLLLLDENRISELSATAVGDLYGDGKTEIIIGGAKELMWYRPATFEKGVIARGHFHCAIAIDDIDGGRRQGNCGRPRD